MKKGIEVKEHKRLLKTVKNCFTGQDAVNWILTNLPIRDRVEACGLGLNLLKRGFIKRYAKENSLKFKDTDELYVFVPPEEVPPFSGEEASTDPDETGEDLSVKPDDFEILHAVGRGGFAKVVKAKKKDNGKIYAMKIMNKTKISGQRQLQCLIAEKKNYVERQSILGSFVLFIPNHRPIIFCHGFHFWRRFSISSRSKRKIQRKRSSFYYCRNCFGS